MPQCRQGMGGLRGAFADERDPVELTEYVRRLAARWRSVVVVMLFVLGAVIAYTATVKPTYESKATLFVASAGNITDLGDQIAAGTYAQQRVLSYASVATSEKMARIVINDLGLAMSPSAFTRKVETFVEYATVLIELRVTDRNPHRAKEIADAIIDHFNPVLAQVEGKSEASVPVTVEPTEFPKTPTSPVTPNIGLNILAALFGGFLLGLVVAALRDFIDDSVKTQESISESGVAVLGSIPTLGRGQGAIVTADDTHSVAEAFRKLRIGVSSASLDAPTRVMVVTSATESVGKSFVTANLAGVFADIGNRVCVVDFDLRHPVLARRLGAIERVGLMNVLVGQVSLDDALQPVENGRFTLLASGPLPPNPADILASGAVNRLLDELKQRFDLVILDSPPIGMFVDARELAAKADSAVLVARRGKTGMRALRHTMAHLTEANSRVLGVILNFDQFVSEQYGGYGYTNRSDSRISRWRRRAN